MFKFSSINNVLIIICVLAFVIVFVHFKGERDNKVVAHKCEDRYIAVFDLFEKMSETLDVDINAFASGNAHGHQILSTDLDLLFRQFRGEQKIIDSIDRELRDVHERLADLEKVLVKSNELALK